MKLIKLIIKNFSQICYDIFLKIITKNDNLIKLVNILCDKTDSCLVKKSTFNQIFSYFFGEIY